MKLMEGIVLEHFSRLLVMPTSAPPKTKPGTTKSPPKTGPDKGGKGPPPKKPPRPNRR